MNPARSLGPDLVAGTMGSSWIYLLGPGCGALLAIGFALAFRGSGSRTEQQAALGTISTGRARTQSKDQ
jgi:aquaporin Z